MTGLLPFTASKGKASGQRMAMTLHGSSRASPSMSDPITLLQSYYRWRGCQPDTAPPGSGPNADRVTACWDAEYGWLVVTLTHAGHTGHIIVTGWEDGVHCLTDLGGKPEILPGQLDPGLPVLDPRVAWAQPWRALIPEDVRLILARFTSGRWALLHWASHSQTALELLRNQPTLLWLLLLTAERKGWPAPHVEKCLELKRRQILELCGLPATAAAVRLLSKLRFAHYGRDALGWLRYGLGEAERLRHARAISLAQLRFTRAFPALVQSPLVHSAPAEAGYFETLAQYCVDTGQLGRRLGRATPSVAIQRCRTLDELRRLHVRWVEQLNRVQEPAARPSRALNWVWPPNRLLAPFQQKLRWWLAWLSRYRAPPVPGTAAIRPITSYRQLLEEGRSQRHCVVGYHDRLLAPETITSTVSWRRSGVPWDSSWNPVGRRASINSRANVTNGWARRPSTRSDIG